ncbi:MAG: RNase J family beta-CASP ribonuclease [Nanoarchaeota archaeon]|nr:RNase J family beta-CASP ribonuclease [Nanoarchaeota archaeon]
MIEIHTVGGYNEVGKNCTAINVDGEVVLCDLGLHLESYIKYTDSDEEDIVKITGSKLMEVGAVPDISVINHLKKNVKAIVSTHAHLDHIGAIPYLSNKFDCEILSTPFSTAVLKAILKDERIDLKNPIKALTVNCSYHLSKNIKLEFINMTHSTPQTVMIAIHTKYGIILYANDFKFDSYPVLGKKPNYERLRELGKKGILALICDSTYAKDARKTSSESVAKEMLKDVLLGTNSRGKLIIMTTFASHLARLKSIIDIGSKLNRKIVFLGRSLAKYVQAGEDVGIVKFSDKVEIVKYGKQIEKRLKSIKDNKRKDYILVVTGHQGEPKAVLSKIVDKKINFNLNPEDHVIFSCKTIPTPTNIENRAFLEKKLREKGIRVFKDIHVSGHAAREDLRDLINLVKPKHIIPAHGNKEMREALADLALEMGYKKENIHLVRDGQKIRV